MERIPATRRRYVVVHTTLMTPNVRRIAFRPVDGPRLHHLAGQWIKLELGEGLARDYSIATAEGRSELGPDVFELYVTLVDGGPGSTRLHALAVGDEVSGLGPNGLFVREDGHRATPALFVATGTGLAPLRAMLDETLHASDGSTPPCTLLFGCRTENDVIARDELSAWAHAHPRFRYEITLSRPDERWTGRTGYVQSHLASLVTTPETHVYVCGLRKMIDEVRQTLKTSLGFDRRFIHSERYD